ncbi:MAG: adenosylcobalamin-dependent ribonucleoside-diphosphate reductase [Chloroflexi bacterium]|nr:adenosylcobalamin-dependent ribonucleoside-diphosphate reductase [Chloroflexota bacterium]
MARTRIPTLTPTALRVLERRYLLKGDEGQVVETPDGMFCRVAWNIAQADKIHDPDADINGTSAEFYELMGNLEFMPNSPTLMNAGARLQQLAACFVLPIDDSLESVFDTLKNAALVHQTGGGTGFSFSRIRPRGDIVRSTKGMASGPLSFLTIYNQATEVIKQGGTRRGANMAILRVDHPAIFDFIKAKAERGRITSFNLSVGVTDAFMEAVQKSEDFDLINPRDGAVWRTLLAREIFDALVYHAWLSGEPGAVFLDEINRHNPTPALGQIEATNPCGEQPLLPYESCVLGSVNLARMIKRGRNGYHIDYDKLTRTVRKSVHFLDNVVSINHYPLPQVADISTGNRKIGLGVMGFADLLIYLGIPYNSLEALATAEEVMRHVWIEGRRMSEELAAKRGTFPNYEKSIYFEAGGPRLRNATVTTVAPTGTISVIAGCSSGIEPLFAVGFVRRILEGEEFFETHPYFQELARREGFYSEELMRKVSATTTIQHLTEIPEYVRRLFVTSFDVEPEWHVRMQAAFQKYSDNAVSKTLNLPMEATVDDVRNIFWLAYQEGCKGVTVYRYGTRELQVLSVRQESCPGACWPGVDTSDRKC